MKPGEATEPTFLTVAMAIGQMLFVLRIEYDGSEEVGVQLLGPDGWWGEWHEAGWRPNGTNKATVPNPAPSATTPYWGTTTSGGTYTVAGTAHTIYSTSPTSTSSTWVMPGGSVVSKP